MEPRHNQDSVSGGVQAGDTDGSGVRTAETPDPWDPRSVSASRGPAPGPGLCGRKRTTASPPGSHAGSVLRRDQP